VGYAGAPQFPGYAIVPGTPVQRGGLGPWPQGIGDVLGTTFRLYFENIKRFLLLGLALAIWPALLAGLLLMGELAVFGINPLEGLFQIVTDAVNSIPTSAQNPGAPPPPFNPPTPNPGLLALLAVGALVYVVLAFVLNAWQSAAFGIAARESVAGRPVRVGAAVREGFRRLPSALGAFLVLSAIIVGVYVLWIIIFAVLSIGLAALLASNNNSSGAPALLLLAYFGAPLAEIPLYVAVVYFSVRLGMAPYIAGADHLSTGAAIGRSWSLTRRNWWRTFTPLLVLYLVIYFVSSLIVTPLLFISIAGLALVGLPLEALLTGPFLALALMVIYYDLRLRREGFGSLAVQLGLAGFAPPPTGGGGPGAG
jgi:hypothetical protein